jgi:GxxExxY protein
MTENEIAKVVVDLCVKIHKILGPGLLESVYEAALVYEPNFVSLRETLLKLIL